jgi:hypothetical protein
VLEIQNHNVRKWTGFSYVSDSKTLGHWIGLETVWTPFWKDLFKLLLMANLEIGLEITFNNSNWRVSALIYVWYSSKDGLTSRPAGLQECGEQHWC